MQEVAPAGPIYQAGTLSGNPLAMVAGLSTLQHLTEDVYQTIGAATETLIDGLVERATRRACRFAKIASAACSAYFSASTTLTITTMWRASNIDQFNAFFHAMLNQGVYLAPSAFEAGFIGATHSSEIIQTTLDAAEVAFSDLACGLYFLRSKNDTDLWTW